jgi:ketosteroid isomerase-like protein
VTILFGCGRTVAGMYDAFGRGDVPYVLAQMAPDVEWIETDAGNIPTHGTFANPQEVLENVFAKVPEHFEQFELRPELWIEAGDDVVVTGRVVARTHTGRKLDAPYAHVFSFPGRKSQPQRQLPRHGIVGSRAVLSLPEGNYILGGDRQVRSRKLREQIRS